MQACSGGPTSDSSPKSVCMCVYIYAAESHSYKSRVPWAPGRGTQSDKSTYEHTENIVFTKLAYDVSSLAASSGPRVLGSPSSTAIVIRPGKAKLWARVRSSGLHAHYPLLAEMVPVALRERICPKKILVMLHSTKVCSYRGWKLVPWKVTCDISANYAILFPSPREPP